MPVTGTSPTHKRGIQFKANSEYETAGNDSVGDLNFKEIVGKQGAQDSEAMKKQEEEKQKFETVKTHFAAGNAVLEQMKQVKNDLQKAPADQRDALKQKLADLSNQA